MSLIFFTQPLGISFVPKCLRYMLFAHCNLGCWTSGKVEAGTCSKAALGTSSASSFSAAGFQLKFLKGGLVMAREGTLHHSSKTQIVGELAPRDNILPCKVPIDVLFTTPISHDPFLIRLVFWVRCLLRSQQLGTDPKLPSSTFLCRVEVTRVFLFVTLVVVFLEIFPLLFEVCVFWVDILLRPSSIFDF